ncbi:MAG: Hsp70 family protein, partial [Proteobacteria bacterium]|nr:Hsp70 family protein [Pseudomonadota bacterium]
MTIETVAAGAQPTGDEARFSIGIDLGTTHCALSWVDRAASDGDEVVQGVLDIPQLTGPASVEGRALLPSFLYLPHESELNPADLALPWDGSEDGTDGVAGIVGEFARTRGAATPIRLVSSAKSWLCHPGVDRRAPLLPAE